MRIDLHTHSRASDGTQSPGDLVRAGREAGLDVIALTDHDSAEGWAEAAAAAQEAGIALVRGMEISTLHEGAGAHLLAYLPDPTYPPLAEELSRILAGRAARLPAILDALRGAGVDICDEDVLRVAGDTVATGRPHVADALVELGVVASRTEAFVRYLNPGRPGNVRRYAASLAAMIPLIEEAGGVSVIAHPWGRHGQERPDEAALAGLAELGLSGVEVDHEDHPAPARDRLRAITRNLGLVVTGASDHHGTGKVDHELGCNTTSPDDYARLMALAADAARRSGRSVPAVVST